MRTLRLLHLLAILGILNGLGVGLAAQACDKCCGFDLIAGIAHRPVSGIGACACPVTECAESTGDECPSGTSCDGNYNDVFSSMFPDCDEDPWWLHDC
jgi:hypothetical protein